MALEIERKFLVNREAWNKTEKGQGKRYSQGYLLTNPDKTIRVRLTDDGGWLTIKGATSGLSRTEFEYPIPRQDAQDMLADFCGAVITKTRYTVRYSGKLWEIDVFHGDNDGLLLAELELESEAETFSLPPFAGQEVTGDLRYYNAYLSKHPYRTWAQ